MPNHHRKKHQQSGRYPRPAKTHHGGFPDRGAPENFRGIPHGVLDSTEESNSDSFRSVIDDLTIKNQKLKKRLRKLEGLHGHTTHAERLFEVRVHDLPEAKKAELEKLLQSFTASIDAESLGQGSSLRSNVTPGNRSSAIDSGYASVSRSGNDFSMPPTRDPNCDESMRMWSAAQTNSELKKMKLVVCRLEQLFTGGEAAVVGDRKVLQQQDISNLAAAEDQEAKLLAGEQVDTEGAREASMMSPPRNNSQDSLSSTDEPEQRPTRPLDLDPQREQVPEDNIEYLTHMTESSIKGSGPQNGWVYLNLIINLAQLHTINVTPPFIKKAIAAASSRLELSADGKMVRWKGNDGSQCNGSGGDGSSEQSPGSGGIRRSADGKSFGSGCESQSGSSGCGSGPGVSALQAREPHRFHYRPIFARSQSFDDDSSSCITSDTDSQEQKRSSSSESRGAGSKKSDTGPIIFYKGGGFCTDLSSQPLREDEELNDEMPTRYVRATTRPLGSIGSTFRHPPSPSTKDESPLYREGMVIPEEDVMEIDRDDDQSVIEFSPQFTATSTIPPVPIEFEASGIGGVLPADNFAINCETKHYLLPENHGRLPVTKSRALKSNLQKRILHRIPKASMDAFYDQDNMTDSSIGSTESKASKSIRPARGRALRHELLSANTLKLPPSSLPPASYIFASPSEDSSSNGETDDDAPRSSGSEGYFFQQAGLDAYRNPSLDEDEAGIIFQRSPSSAATAGDGSRTSSVFSDRNVEDPTYEGPLSMDSEQSSSVGSGYTQSEKVEGKRH
ncbi:hypothetical protein K440DRAFT_174455 [Wilcoxina mikolae CBS 423.85]|nr:hypothetical protein K440DRAFT_174455 [Wilcoxina mikolae CBS 423.85]